MVRVSVAAFRSPCNNRIWVYLLDLLLHVVSNGLNILRRHRAEFAILQIEENWRLNTQLLARACSFFTPSRHQWLACCDAGMIAHTFLTLSRDRQIHLHMFSGISREHRSHEELVIWMRRHHQQDSLCLRHHRRHHGKAQKCSGEDTSYSHGLLDPTALKCGGLRNWVCRRDGCMVVILVAVEIAYHPLRGDFPNAVTGKGERP